MRTLFLQTFQDEVLLSDKRLDLFCLSQILRGFNFMPAAFSLQGVGFFGEFCSLSCRRVERLGAKLARFDAEDVRLF